MDPDLLSIQQARELLRAARAAQHLAKALTQEQVDAIVEAMAKAGAAKAEHLGKLAHQETGFGRPESKKEKNLFATTVLAERMRGMRTVGVVRKLEGDSVWEVASPMGVIGALIPSTNPTSTAMYKAIIAAKARCGIVMSPHPRAKDCTYQALAVVAEAAYRAGAPKGLFGCMSEISLAGTDALLEDPEVDVILATGGSAMVKAAYSKGKPAYGVGSGNVPVYVDRSADVDKAARDLVYGPSFDWGTLCSTERSVVCDLPVKASLIQAMKHAGAHFVSDAERALLRAFVVQEGRLNIDQVGRSPDDIARMAGFRVPKGTRVLVSEASEVGQGEPLSRETLSPILTFYSADGWEAGCERCMEVLAYGGMGHTLGLHATSERVIEAFALQKPAMRVVVNSVAALGSVGFTTRLFPAMTLGPGTLGGSITSDNISPLHLLNVKRVAFETSPIHPSKSTARPIGTDASKSTAGPIGTFASTARPGRGRGASAKNGKEKSTQGSWMEEIESRLRARAGSPPASVVGSQGGTGHAHPPLPTSDHRTVGAADPTVTGATSDWPRTPSDTQKSTSTEPSGLSPVEIDAIVREFRR